MAVNSILPAYCETALNQFHLSPATKAPFRANSTAKYSGLAFLRVPFLSAHTGRPCVRASRNQLTPLLSPARQYGAPTTAGQQSGGVSYAYERHREVVQSREGFRFHHPRGW